jgi:hypothetical protein
MEKYFDGAMKKVVSLTADLTKTILEKAQNSVKSRVKITLSILY